MDQTWLLLSVAGAFFTSVYFFLGRKMMGKSDAYSISAMTSIIVASLLLFVSFLVGFPSLGSSFFIDVAIASVVVIPSMVMLMRALISDELSSAVPMLSFTPVFMIATSFFLLGEVPSFLGIVGVLLIFLGSYLLSPTLSFSSDRSCLLMLALAFVYSISSVLCKKVIVESDAFFGYGIIYLVAALFFTAFCIFRKIPLIKGNNAVPMMSVGFILAISEICIGLALSMQLAAYVIAVKRLSVLFTTAAGIILLRESRGKIKLIAASIMLVGMIVIALF